MIAFLTPDSSAFLFNARGARKYLTDKERRKFLLAAEEADPRTRAFCRTLAYTGCRISEGLLLTRANLDPATGRVVFTTLKRRKRVFRAVPVPPALMIELGQLGFGHPEGRLWIWCRQTGWRGIKAVMAQAGIRGAHATPKGLRHGFGIANAERNIPPGLTQYWMGHARLETTMLYQHAVGDEETAFARRLW